MLGMFSNPSVSILFSTHQNVSIQKTISTFRTTYDIIIIIIIIIISIIIIVTVLLSLYIILIIILYYYYLLDCLYLKQIPKSSIGDFFRSSTMGVAFGDSGAIRWSQVLRVILVETQQPLDEQSLDTWRGRVGCSGLFVEISNGRTHCFRTPKKPEYLIARSQLPEGSVGKVVFNFWWMGCLLKTGIVVFESCEIWLDAPPFWSVHWAPFFLICSQIISFNSPISKWKFTEGSTMQTILRCFRHFVNREAQYTPTCKCFFLHPWN